MTEQPSHIEKIREKCERLNEDLEELKEAYGLNDDDQHEHKTNVEVPAAGRTNREAGRTDTMEVEHEKPETETVEVEIPTPGRTNDETTMVEREVPADSGMEEIEEWKRRIHEIQVESIEERVERKQSTRQARMNAGPYSLDDDAEDLEIPAAGRSHWEERQDGDD